MAMTLALVCINNAQGHLLSIFREFAKRTPPDLKETVEFSGALNLILSLNKKRFRGKLFA